MRTEVIRVMLTFAEKEAVVDAAKQEGLAIAAFVRQAALASARK